MNCGIIIYEQEEYLYRLLKFRLSSYLPDSYITHGIIGDYLESITPFADNLFIIFNNFQYTKELICKEIENLALNISLIPLFADDNQIVDCKNIYSQIIKNQNTLSFQSGNKESGALSNHVEYGKTLVLLPFTYIKERETFIDEELNAFKNQTNLCLRLDLMPGIRMPSTFTELMPTGGLTSVLEAASRDKLSSEDILSYCSPDNKGFLTLGKPKHSDDVADYGIDTIIKTINKAIELTNNPAYPMNLLVVAETFRFSELTQICQLADEVRILVSEQQYNDDYTLKAEIGNLTRSLGADIPTKIHFSEKYKGKKYEPIKI